MCFCAEIDKEAQIEQGALRFQALFKDSLRPFGLEQGEVAHHTLLSSSLQDRALIRPLMAQSHANTLYHGSLGRV